MRFRLKAFGLHLLSSVCVLSVVWGALYLGWYYWPGWYLCGALGITAIMAAVDVVLGPSLTLIIANPKKPRRELLRDISIIGAVQLAALIYGAITLWHGRPLYYAYSERFLQIVQAGDLDPEQVALGRKLNPSLAPHWWSRPRWIYAPLPSDKKSAQQIVAAAVTGGNDVIQMPRYYQPWEAALPELRKSLRLLGNMTELSGKDKAAAAERMRKRGFAPEQPIVLPMLGRGKPLIAVFDPGNARMKALIRVD